MSFTANGFRVGADGVLKVGPPPIVGYAMGLPFNADGHLVVQLNVPAFPGDAYVGGIRVGPNGGVYVVDTTPPPESFGFANGFSTGFDTEATAS